MKRFFPFALPLLLVVSACTMVYKPGSTWEESVSKKSRKDIFPDDVRGCWDSFKDQRVAWAGLIEEPTFEDKGGSPRLNLVLEHHYYDWLVDGGGGRYWLSPRGEGQFKASWPLKKEWDIAALKRIVNKGDMVIVYGKPKSTDQMVIDLGTADYVRLIRKPLVRADVLDYDRRGSACMRR